MKKILFTILFLTLAVILPGKVSAFWQSQASNITDTSAKLTTNASPGEVGYYRYATAKVPPVFCNQIYGSNAKSTPDLTSFTYTLEGLTPNTDYYFCAVKSAKAGLIGVIDYGTENSLFPAPVYSFRTLPCQTCPQTYVKTVVPTVLNAVSANLRGEFGSTKQVKTYFEYKEKGLVGAWTKSKEELHAPKTYGKFNLIVGELKPSTVYEFRAVAQTITPVETFYGDIFEFKTKTEDGFGDGDGWVNEDPESPTQDCAEAGPDAPATGCDDPYNNDNDGDGTPDDVDPDDDNDGTPDDVDPDDNDNGIDDTTEDNSNNGGSSEETGDNGDNDGDGEQDSTDPDDDNDGVPDNEDPTPKGESDDGLDNDNDGVDNGTDGDDDNDGIPDATDPDPYGGGENNPFDNDNDGTTNDQDTDNDNDGIPNSDDGTPFGDCSYDNDNDGINNCADEDDDNDGIKDDFDTTKYGGSEGSDYDNDGDGIPNNIDTDNDNDGIPNNSDATPFGGGNPVDPNTGRVLKIGDYAVPPVDAIVRYHEGVETVFIRQIMRNTTLANKYGYKNGQDLQSFANYLAHFLAKHYGYVAKNGKEVRVREADIAAYELRESGSSTIVYEYYDNKVTGIRRLNSLFKLIFKYEYYFLKLR